MLCDGLLSIRRKCCIPLSQNSRGFHSRLLAKCRRAVLTDRGALSEADPLIGAEATRRPVLKERGLVGRVS